MINWEAKYKALAIGATDESIAAAEKLVKIAMDFGHSGLYPPGYTLDMMLKATVMGRQELTFSEKYDLLSDLA